MTSVRPMAANGVSFGLTPVIAGRTRPTPPRNSQSPMKMIRSCGTAESQGTSWSAWFHRAGLYQRILPKPVTLQKTPDNTWVVQSTASMALFASGRWLTRFIGFLLPAHQLRDLNEIAAGVVQHGDLRARHVPRWHGELGATRFHTLVI